MKCIVCAKEAVVSCDDLDLCLDHHLEKHEGQHSFITKYGLQGFLEREGYHFCSYTKRWSKAECRKNNPMEVLREVI